MFGGRNNYPATRSLLLIVEVQATLFGVIHTDCCPPPLPGQSISAADRPSQLLVVERASMQVAFCEWLQILLFRFHLAYSVSFLRGATGSYVVSANSLE